MKLEEILFLLNYDLINAKIIVIGSLVVCRPHLFYCLREL